MSQLRQTCLHHPDRAAVARCPSCAQSFCRECIVEHEGRLLCVDCLQAQKISRAAAKSKWWYLPLMPALQVMMAIGMVYLLFLTYGKIIRSIPPDYHSGMKWEK